MKGTSPTVVKGMGLNLGMFATFDTVREILNEKYKSYFKKFFLKLRKIIIIIMIVEVM